MRLQQFETNLEEDKPKGLYYYVNKNKKSGKTPRKKGAEGAPTDQDWKDAAKTAKESVEGVCPDCGNPSYTTLPEEKQKGVDGKVCWKGYRRMGTKKKGGKTVDNCVKIKEGSSMAMMADMVEKDHEVDMARSDLYKLAKYSIKLHNMLKNITEAEGLQGWQQSKITKAADYIASVYHNLDYEMKFAESKYRPKASTPYKDNLMDQMYSKLISEKMAHGKVYSSGGRKFKYNANAKGDELALVPVQDKEKVVTSRTTDGKMKKFKMSKKSGLTPVKEEKHDMEYKGWLKIYNKSPDAAESHPKHTQFLARYKKEQKK